jgi:hypothetical protein
MKFIPNKKEQKMLEEINKEAGLEFGLIRLTYTMLDKSIIDAGLPIREMFNDYQLVDYGTITPGDKPQLLRAKILTSDVHEEKASFYRPKTKKGDPRFCIYNLRKYMRETEMFYISVLHGEVVVIPLVETLFNIKTVKKFFKDLHDDTIKDELVELLKALKNKGPVLSVSPFKSNPKDVGETLERELFISPNSSQFADFREKIEIKAKRAASKTKDTLFSMVPDWSASSIKSANSMIITHGYTSKKHEGFLDLYVTINNKPNNQGLYLWVDEDEGILHQLHINESDEISSTCIWDLKEVKNRLYQKHQETVWVVAKEIVIDGKIYFIFDSVEYTRTPIFSSFLLLIAQGIVTYDWRGRVKPDKSKYKDKGHCFRIVPKKRRLLFGEIETISL